MYQSEIKRWDNKNLLKKTYSYKNLTGNRTTEQVSSISYAIGTGTTESELTYLSHTLTWEKGRQLKSSTKNGITTSYTYDVNGLRTRKKVGSTTYDYTYVNGKLMAYEEGSNKMMFSYDEAGNPFGLWYNESIVLVYKYGHEKLNNL